MQRIPEPEIMDDEAQAAAYAHADFSDSNQAFVDGLVAAYPDHLSNILDIGCGPADIPVRIVRKAPAAKIVAIDASAPMIALARQAVQTVGFQNNIEVRVDRLPGLKLNQNFSAIISKDLLHHLPDPAMLWQEIKAVAKAKTAVYVMDLFRPDSPEKAASIVEAIAPNAEDILKQDFYNSLLAAFTVEEVTQQLLSAGLSLDVNIVSERHMLISGEIFQA